MTGEYLVHDAPDRVLACPTCDRAGQLRHREDGVVKCYECGGTCERSAVVDRADERGEHTPREACAKGGRKAMARHGRPQSQTRGQAPGPKTGPLAED